MTAAGRWAGGVKRGVRDCREVTAVVGVGQFDYRPRAVQNHVHTSELRTRSPFIKLPIFVRDSEEGEQSSERDSERERTCLGPWYRAPTGIRGSFWTLPLCLSSWVQAFLARKETIGRLKRVDIDAIIG
ncbi:hypothetical protein B0H11DRAFT_1903641 [Mycena galericulata]|nr:hypothetical protein B0H11DRAFT_1903641 [Mycena galericulata]